MIGDAIDVNELQADMNCLLSSNADFDEAV